MACRGCQVLGENTTLRTEVGWWIRMRDLDKSRRSCMYIVSLDATRAWIQTQTRMSPSADPVIQ